MMDYPRFSTFADGRDGHPLEGKKRRMEEIFNLELLVTAFRVDPSKKNAGECLTIQFELNGEKQVIFTGSDVLKNQLKRYEDKLPFLTKIIKNGKYFTLS